MINVINKIINKYFSSWEYKAILMYIALGSIFACAQSSNFSYTNMFLFSFTNKTFLTIILYPSFIAMYISLFTVFNSNNEIILRLGERKNYVRANIILILFSSAILFLHSIIIQLIFCNIFRHKAFEITYILGYSENDLIILIISIIKLFLTVLSIGILNLLLTLKFNNKKISIYYLLIFLMIIYFGNRFYSNNNIILNIFNPAFHSHGYNLTKNLSYSLVSGFIYFSSVFTVYYILTMKFVRNIYIGVGDKQ